MFFQGFFCRKWTNLIGSYGFIHYVQVDDSTNIAQIAAERRWKCGIWNYFCIWILYKYHTSSHRIVKLIRQIKKLFHFAEWNNFFYIFTSSWLTNRMLSLASSQLFRWYSCNDTSDYTMGVCIWRVPYNQSRHAILRCTMHYVVLLFTLSLVTIFAARLIFKTVNMGVWAYKWNHTFSGSPKKDCKTVPISLHIDTVQFTWFSALHGQIFVTQCTTKCKLMQKNVLFVYFFPTTQATIGCLNSAIIRMHTSMFSVS
jgi:hypothetical protein